MSESAESYDEVPYPSGPYWRTQPSHLAMIARLFGLTTPSIGSCRVLELGCAAGGNLLPLAEAYPDATFVGIDLSKRQIEEGHRTIAGAALTNVELHQGSILDIDERWGEFDYIVCHGVFSWVPTEVREKILSVARERLTPHGVACISYNTFPGWHLRAIVRDMMNYHVEPIAEASQKIRQARLLLDFLIRGSASRTAAYDRVLRDEAEILQHTSDSYLFHEHLESINQPFYFHEFAAMAEACDLQFLGETDFDMMLPTEFAPEIANLLKNAPLLRQEQYLDFLRNRMFRSTLLCHGNLTLNRHVTGDRWQGLHVRLPLRPKRIEPAAHDGPMAAWTMGSQRVSATSPITQAAIEVLADHWPCWLGWEELTQRSRAKLNRPPTSGDAIDGSARDILALGEDLIQLLANRLLRAAVEPPAFTATLADRPYATRLARFQAAQQLPVTNCLHTTVGLDPLSRALLTHIDGNHREQDLAVLVQHDHAAGRINVTRNETTLSTLDDKTATELVRHGLNVLVEQSLLVR